MGIIGVISRSLREMLWPRRFLPFFLLYLIFSLSLLIFLLPILSRIPSFYTSPSSVDVQIFYANLAGIAIALIATVLVNIWFSGALIWDIKSKKGFEKCLKYSKKVYLQMFALCLVICILVLLTFFLKSFSIIFQILIDWIFIFALPAVVIKKDSFDFALARSFNLVKKKVFSTFSFWVLTRFIIFVIFLFSLFISTAILLPIFSELRFVISSTAQAFQSYEVTRAISLILQNYHLLVIEAIVASFFVSIMYTFNLISKTYYFLEISKKAR